MNKQRFTNVFLVILIILLVGIVGYFIFIKITAPASQQSSAPQTNQNEVANWQTMGDKDATFSFKCPADWKKFDNLNYNGLVNLVECSKIYSEIAFDDGVSVSFGFVSDEASNYKWANEKYSETLINNVKNETNAKSYSNKLFEGWVSMKNEKHTLILIARMPVAGGYYEVSGEAEGDRLTDVEYKGLVDRIIASFNLAK